MKSNNAGDLGMITTVDIHVPAQADLYKIKKIIYAEAKNNSYVDSNNKISVVSKEMLGGHGIVCFLMTVKCHIKDA